MFGNSPVKTKQAISTHKLDLFELVMDFLVFSDSLILKQTVDGDNVPPPTSAEVRLTNIVLHSHCYLAVEKSGLPLLGDSRERKCSVALLWPRRDLQQVHSPLATSILPHRGHFA